MTGALALLIGVASLGADHKHALIFSHGSRSLIYLPHIHFRAFGAVMLGAIPFIVLTSLIYTILPVNILAAVLAVIIFASIPSAIGHVPAVSRRVTLPDRHRHGLRILCRARRSDRRLY